MKNVLLFLFLTSASYVHGQGILSQPESRASSSAFRQLSMFKKSTSLRQRPTLPEVSSYDLLEADPRIVDLLLDERPKTFSIALPGPEEQPLELELTQVHILTEDYTLQVSNQTGALEPNQGVFYQGKIKGDATSIATISVFPEGIQAMFSSPSLGDHHIARLPSGDESAYMLYADRHLRNPTPFECHTEDSGRPYLIEELTPQATVRAANSCVRVYLEIDYDVYQSKGSVTATENYIKGLFNEVVALYKQDGISVILSQMFIWAIESPYPDSDIYTVLRKFQSYRTSMNGDVGQLLTYKGSGGIAVVDGLCRTNVSSKLGVSSIDNSYRSVPQYSFSVMVLAHEIGHILGSQHTHACVWNGNNTAIDGCAGATEGSCSNPGIPSSGGTIMSYCHLTSAGINFLNGFGPQPAALIRNRIANAACLQVCNTSGPDTTGSQGCDSIVLTLTLDNFGSETTWQILNSQGQVVMQGGPYSNKQSGQVFSIPVCMPYGCYTFKVKDSDGDGMCCTHGNGSFRLTRKTGALLAAGGQFGSESSTPFCLNSVVNPPPPPPPPAGCTLVDFNTTPPRPYGGTQDAGQATVLDDGKTIMIENNAWKMVPLEYDIKSTTMLAFDFKSTSQGEVHGIGFDNDLYVSSQLTFQLFGSQSWGLQSQRNYTSLGSWKTYVIPIGKSYTGKAKYLFFAMDDDVSPALGNSYFRNVRVYESTSSCGGLEGQINATPASSSRLQVPSKLSVFPNPATDRIQIEATGLADGSASLSVYNTLGQELRLIPVEVSGGEVTFDMPVGTLNNGSYTVRLRSGDQMLIQSVIIQK